MNILLSTQTSMFIVVLLFALGIILIVKGGDFFVDASSWIAEKSGIPKFIIGATIVSIATTLPELLVSVIGAIDGKHLADAGDMAGAIGQVGMSVGNAIGSVTANTGLIMGISLCFMPAVIKRKSYLLKSLMLIVATALIWLLSLNSELSVLDSVFLLIILVCFITENIISGKREQEVNKVLENDNNSKEEQDKTQPKVKTPVDKKDLVINLLKFVFGAAGIVIGAQLLVDEGTLIAQKLGVSEAIIGLTMVAIGTSLPELVTTITAIVKKESSLSVGNIIGANLIDICMILPVCSFVYGGSFPIENRTIYLDMPVCLGFILIALVPTLIRGKFSKVQGFILVSLYLAYAIVISVVSF